MSVRSCGLSLWGRMGMANNRNGYESSVTLGAEVAGEVGEHAVKDFVGIGWLGFRFVGRLAKA